MYTTKKVTFENEITNTTFYIGRKIVVLNKS